jgi:hypothetical protein
MERITVTRDDRFRLRSTETCFAALASCVLALAFLAPILRAFENWGIEDWDYWAAHHEAARKAILGYGQFPHWNPWACGGMDLLAHPGSRALAPTSLILLWLGAVSGLKVEILLHGALGSLGLWALGREHGLDRTAAWLAPLGSFFGSFYALPVSAGMVWFTSVAYLPWAQLFAQRAIAGESRARAPAGAALALTFLGGGAYPLVIAFAWLALEAALRGREIGFARAAARAGLVGALGLALCAVKLLPAIEFTHDFPRHANRTTGFSVESLAIGLFSHDQRLDVAATRFDAVHPGEFLRGISADFDDVGMYVGPAITALFLLGLATRARRNARLLVTLATFLLLSFGNRLPGSPYMLLSQLPVLDGMRFAERYRIVWLPCALLIAGDGLTELRCRLAKRLPGRPAASLAGAVVLAAIAADQLSVSRPIYAMAFPIRPLRLPPPGEFRQVVGIPNYDADGFVPRPYGQARIYGAWSAHYPAFLMNVGFVRCYESAPVRTAAIPMRSRAYRGEAHLEGTSGRISIATWSPNRLRFAVSAESPGRLVINQNYTRGWRANDGRPVRSADGLVVVDVGPADREVELSYRRPSFGLGAAVSAVATLLAFVGVLRPRSPVSSAFAR